LRFCDARVSWSAEHSPEGQCIHIFADWQRPSMPRKGRGSRQLLRAVKRHTLWTHSSNLKISKERAAKSNCKHQHTAQNKEQETRFNKIVEEAASRSSERQMSDNDSGQRWGVARRTRRLALLAVTHTTYLSLPATHCQMPDFLLLCSTATRTESAFFWKSIRN
jgi:hypothetical protein